MPLARKGWRLFKLLERWGMKIYHDCSLKEGQQVLQFLLRFRLLYRLCSRSGPYKDTNKGGSTRTWFYVQINWTRLDGIVIFVAKFNYFILLNYRSQFYVARNPKLNLVFFVLHYSIFLSFMCLMRGTADTASWCWSSNIWLRIKFPFWAQFTMSQWDYNCNVNASRYLDPKDD